MELDGRVEDVLLDAELDEPVVEEDPVLEPVVLLVSVTDGFAVADVVPEDVEE